MNGTGFPADGQIQQTFATISGSNYLVSFEFSGNFNKSSCPVGDTQVVEVQASGNDQLSYTFTKPPEYSYQNMGWLTENYAFHTATSTTTTTLTFTADSNNTTNCGPVLADVKVNLSSSVTSCASQPCTVNLQSSSTGTSGTITANSSSRFLLQATFGSGYALSCESAVTGHFPADPLLVISYPQVSRAPTVNGSVTLTFPKKIVHEVPSNKGTPHMPVCVGANEPFPGSAPVTPSLTSPFSDVGLLYACNTSTYRADLAALGNSHLNICVSSYSRVHGAERVVIQTSSFGDPMFW